MLWAYRTTNRKSKGESPFALTYRMQAIIPTEIRMPTIRTKILKQASTKAIIKDLDMTDKLREAATIRIASYQPRLASYHNRCVKPCTFKTGELVLRRVFENTSNLVDGKFQPNWEGPYTVVRVWKVGSYSLSRPYENVVPRMWNATHLKKYYQ